FGSSDVSPGVVLPPDSTLTNGQGTFSATLIKAGPQSLTAADMPNSLSGTAGLTVAAAPASRLALATATAAPIAGTSFSFTVTAQIGCATTRASYAVTLHFRTSDSS